KIEVSYVYSTIILYNSVDDKLYHNYPICDDDIKLCKFNE
ncbi:MAG: hypothetical protein RLZZ86_1996, partial [Cyanobacteriota bacterium]